MMSFSGAFTVGSGLAVYRDQDQEYWESDCDQLKSDSNFCSSNEVLGYSEETGFSKSPCCVESGQVIFSKNESMIYLPNLPKSTVTAVCVNCGKVLEVALPGWRDRNTCIICRWPLCENGCDFEEGAMVRNSHSTFECSTLFKAGGVGFIWNGDPTMYLYLWVVRIALVKEQDPISFECLMNPTFPVETLSEASLNSDEIVDVARHWFPIIAEVVSHEELVKIGQIVLWKMKSIVCEGELLTQVQPVIVETSFAHSCYPNLRRFSQTDPYKWLVLRDVTEGDLLTFSYDAASVFSPTPERIQRLFDCYNFWCSCSRCKDDTEFGTNFSIFPCWSADCSVKVLPCNLKVDLHPSIWQPASFIRKDKRNKSKFVCSSCKTCYTSQQLQTFQIDFQNRVYRSRDSLFYLNLILKQENRLRRLHCTNYMFFEAAWNILNLLTNAVDITNISFLEEAHYMDFVLPAECVHFVVKRFCPELFSLKHGVSNHIFRVIALIRLAILTEDFRCGNVTLVEVERRLQDISEACNPEPRVLSTLSKWQLLKSRSNLKPGNFEFVEHHGIKLFVTGIEDYLMKKNVIFKLRKLANKE